MGNNPIAPRSRSGTTTALASAALRLTMNPCPDTHIGWFREQYVAGRIELEEFERRVDKALAGFYYEPTNGPRIFG